MESARAAIADGGTGGPDGGAHGLRPVRPAAPVGPWAGQGIFRTGRPWAAAVGLGLSENRSARRSVDPERDRDDQVFGDDYFPVEE